MKATLDPKPSEKTIKSHSLKKNSASQKGCSNPSGPIKTIFVLT